MWNTGRRFIIFIGCCLSFNSYKATTTYTVGASGTYTTIASAYAACTGATEYVLEIRSDYTTESLPITLGALTNKSASNTVTIRPATGLSGLTITTGTASHVFKFNGADYVIIDGRLGGAGTGDFTLENTQTAAGKYAIEFTSDATYNTIKYCTVKGSNSTTTNGLIYFGTASAGGNDNNSIDHCTLQKSGAGSPANCIYSNGSASNTNSGITISNCNMADFTSSGIYVAGNSDTWSVSNNSFYQSASFTPANDVYMLYMNAGGGYTVTGNYFGGQSSSCGGSAYTLASSAYKLAGIKFGSSVSGSDCVLSSNTVQNISHASSASVGFAAIDVAGAVNFTIGSVGNANTIGAGSGTGSIVLTASGTPTTIFYGINTSSTGTGSIAYNTIGAITITGTATGTGNNNFINVSAGAGATSVDHNTIGNTTASNISIAYDGYDIRGINYAANSNGTISNNTLQNINVSWTTGTSATLAGIYFSGTGTNSISSNTIGSTTSNNMTFAADVPVYGIALFSAGTYTVNNNTIQQFNLSLSGTSANLYCIYAQTTTTVSASGNTFKNITNASTASSYGFDIVSDNNHTISSNTLQDFTLTGSLYGVYLYGTGTSSISSNTIGSSSTNNLSIGSNFYGIFVDAAGSFTINGNTIQQANLTSASGNFYGIRLTQSVTTAATLSASSNSIKNITSAGTAATLSYAASLLSASSVTFSSNSMQDITMSSPFYAVYYASLAGSGILNSNTIGGATANNMTLHYNGTQYGIVLNSDIGVSCNNNVVQGFNLTATGTSNRFVGIDAWGDGTTSLSNDTVRNMNSASTSTSSTLRGIGCSSAYTTIAITKCAVQNLSLSATSANVIVDGVYLSAGSGSLSKCHVSGNKIVSTGASASNTGIILTSTGNWNFYNNVVLADNGADAHSPRLRGIYFSSTGTSTFYHNTVKLFGSATSGSGNSSCIYKDNASGTVTLKNNIWQNVRTGGSGTHYAVYINNTGGTSGFDYNYLETSASPIAFWTSGQSAIANWRSASGASSREITGTITIETSMGFTMDPTIKSAGTNLAATVSDDKEDNTRAAAPWIGAWEKAPVVLPVELIYFTAICKNTFVELNWATANESNNDFFTVERSEDGFNFEPLLVRDGAGNSNSTRLYTATTEYSTEDKTIYFRLKQTDFDGKYTYSSIAAAQCNTKTTRGIAAVYPNPCSGKVNVQINADEEYLATICVLDAYGQLLFELAEKINSGSNQVQVDLSGLNSGMYFIQVSNSNNILSTFQKVIRH